jgi:hypothetical protein
VEKERCRLLSRVFGLDLRVRRTLGSPSTTQSGNITAARFPVCWSDPTLGLGIENILRSSIQGLVLQKEEEEEEEEADLSGGILVPVCKAVEQLVVQGKARGGELGLERRLKLDGHRPERPFSEFIINLGGGGGRGGRGVLY